MHEYSSIHVPGYPPVYVCRIPTYVPVYQGARYTSGGYRYCLIFYLVYYTYRYIFIRRVPFFCFVFGGMMISLVFMRILLFGTVYLLLSVLLILNKFQKPVTYCTMRILSLVCYHCPIIRLLIWYSTEYCWKYKTTNTNNLLKKHT